MCTCEANSRIFHCWKLKFAGTCSHNKKNKKKIKNNKNPAAQNACYCFLVQVCFEQRLSSSDRSYSGNVTQFLPHSLEPRVFYKEAQMFISLTTARSCCQHISLFQEKNKHKCQVCAKFSPKQLSPLFS